MQESISFDKDLRQAIKDTIKPLAKAVKSTLGPSGTNVGTLSQILLPVIVNDGVTVANKTINSFKDPLKKYIANIIKTVSQNTDNIAGDGTTTSITLTEAIVLEGLKNIEAGFSQIDIVEGIRQATILVLKELDKKTLPIKNNKERLLQVASISANNDPILGKIISEAFLKVGVDGQIEIKDSSTNETYTDTANGMKYDSGMESNMFTNTDSSEAILEDCKVLIYEGKLQTIDPIIEALKDSRANNTSLLIIADDYSERTIEDLIYNKINAKVKVCAVKSPGYGIAKENNLDDLSDITNTKIISRRFGRNIEDFNINHLGFSTSVKIDLDSFTIINDKVNKTLIKNKITKLKKELKKLSSGVNTSELEGRVAKLSNGVAVLYVSGSSPVEIAEKKFRIEDAINATRASLEEGIIPGGGITLLKLGNKLKMPKMQNRGQEIGFCILISALESPIRTICYNAGQSADVVVSEVLKGEFNYGFDAKLKKYGDLIEEGIIDPKKVTKTALVNASSVSQMILTMNCAIYE